MVPIAEDQLLYAAPCAALKTGRVFAPADLTPEAAWQAELSMVTDPGKRVAAERMRNEIDTLPGQEHAVALLRRLSAERQPTEASKC
jgi:UDP:flavonoid glycosyltransferase YjiC (YdhE family)